MVPAGSVVSETPLGNTKRIQIPDIQIQNNKKQGEERGRAAGPFSQLLPPMSTLLLSGNRVEILLLVSVLLLPAIAVVILLVGGDGNGEAQRCQLSIEIARMGGVGHH